MRALVASHKLSLAALTQIATSSLRLQPLPLSTPIALPPVRPLVLLGADWSPRVVDGSWGDVWRLALKEQNSRTEAQP